ncbi:MAG: radical SAM protein [Peptococcaceae bacterium]|nr:radical SAM protein [Peptococcaceae bacterium]
MLRTYQLNGECLDSIDLKVLVISKGVKVSKQVYSEFGKTSRIFPDPLKCNCFLLPDGTVTQLTDLAFHLNYLKSALSWDALKKIKYFSELNTPFSLDISDSGTPALFYHGKIVTDVQFPSYSDFYKQKTSQGLPFLGSAVLQGTEWLSFQCLWGCDYACAGEPCQFCYSGGIFHSLTKRGKALPAFPTPQDVAEIVEFAVVKAKCARSLQITGGSTFNVQAECDKIKEYLEAINTRVGRENIPGEILLYTTPPHDPRLVDQLFQAGADRIACSLEIWDENLAKEIMPGKAKYTGRKRHLDCLEYIADQYGPNKACSSFVVGVEPAESYLEGAEYLASRGIVPIASVWVPFGSPVLGNMQAPGLSFYRQVKNGLARIYAQYGIEPPGGKGLNVCMCRDSWLHRQEVSNSCS